MRERRRLSSWGWAGPLALALLIACTPANGVKTPKKTGIEPAKADTPAASDAPGQSAIPVGESATPSAPTSSIPAVLPSPPSKLTPAHQALKPVLIAKLAAIAEVAYDQDRGQLVANNSASLVANNGAGLISNNGGGLVGDHGGAYRLAADPAPIRPDAGPDEQVNTDQIWPDGTRDVSFVPLVPATDGTASKRDVSYYDHDHPQEEDLIVTSHIDGDISDFDTVQRIQTKDGQAIGRLHFQGHVGAEGQDFIALVPDGAFFRDPWGGFEMGIDKLQLDYRTGLGSFRITYPLAKLVETGKLENLRRQPGGGTTFIFSNPYIFADGESSFEGPDGKVLYKKSSRRIGEGPGILPRDVTFDLLDDLTVVMKWEDISADRPGKVLLKGVQEAEVTLDLSPDGSRIFTVVFPEEPEHPIIIGYGAKPTASAPPATPWPSPPWEVSTLAGQAVGSADGPGATARFSDFLLLAASRVKPGRVYIGDSGNHVIRTLDVAADGSVTVARYAGTGTAGYANGPRLSAAFNVPCELVAGPDDTLYVADEGNARVRKITPDGTVSTLAGNDDAVTKDGQGEDASFALPTGLALAPDGTLYVSDSSDHVIRRISSTGSVTTLAGLAGTAGDTDGVGTAARFSVPFELTLDRQGRVVVSDSSNLKLRLVTPTGKVTTLAGGLAFGKTAIDGNSLDRAVGATDLEMAPDGRIFFAGLILRTLEPDGRVISFAGHYGASVVDGYVKDAHFLDISSLSLGSKGEVYVSDGARIRVVRPPSPEP